MEASTSMYIKTNAYFIKKESSNEQTSIRGFMKFLTEEL